MACTSQSAEGYIRSARRHLVGELKNLTVILENLYQRGVLCDEEVSKIQAEKDDYDKTRKILDSVTNKGEKACYEFLKIIDMTRKRTLVRHPLHPGTKTFDLALLLVPREPRLPLGLQHHGHPLHVLCPVVAMDDDIIHVSGSI
uniref:CARD domain-containing protein n=1 Tax=Neolamprologus brichardi TaxID=32507 RepID=A0A3Q4N7Q9_NEOBR